MDAAAACGEERMTTMLKLRHFTPRLDAANDPPPRASRPDRADARARRRPRAALERARADPACLPGGDAAHAGFRRGHAGASPPPRRQLPRISLAVHDGGAELRAVVEVWGWAADRDHRGAGGCRALALGAGPGDGHSRQRRLDHRARLCRSGRLHRRCVFRAAAVYVARFVQALLIKEVVNEVEPAPVPAAAASPAVEVSASAIETRALEHPAAGQGRAGGRGGGGAAVAERPAGRSSCGAAAAGRAGAAIGGRAAAVETRGSSRLDFLFVRAGAPSVAAVGVAAIRHNKRRRSTRSGPSARRAKASPILGSKWLARPRRPPPRIRRPPPRSLRRRHRKKRGVAILKSGRGRRYGLHALRRRFDRGAATAGNGALRIDRGIARAHREQRLASRVWSSLKCWSDVEGWSGSWG